MTEFRHEIPMRWADLDSLNHVNNVVYLEYAAQARAAAGVTGPIARTTIEFLRPLLLSRTPVEVVTRVEGTEVHQTIGVRGVPHEFARVEVLLGAPEPPPEPRPAPHRPAHAEPFVLRLTDIDRTGEVGDAQCFELFQEIRIPFIDATLDRLVPGRFVVGRVVVDHLRPITYRAEPLATRTWISRVGGSSYTIHSQLLDESGVLAASSSVLVGFDLSTQRSRPLGDDERARLTAAMD